MAKNNNFALLGLITLGVGGFLLLKNGSNGTSNQITPSIGDINCTITDERELSDGTIVQDKGCGGTITIKNNQEDFKNIEVRITAIEDTGSSRLNVAFGVVDFSIDGFSEDTLPYFINSTIIKGNTLFHRFDFNIDGQTVRTIEKRTPTIS